MSRSALFRRFRRTLSLALTAERQGISSSEAIAKKAAASTRREFLGGLGALAAAGLAGGALSGCAPPDPDRLDEALIKGASSLDVGIVGAGLGGLCCADQLRSQGVIASVYEGNTRIGGRQWSQAGYFPGQVIERGGELIDTSQKLMINYARAFGLTLEDYLKAPGETAYYIDGAAVAEADVVDDYRAFVAAMGDDLRQISGAPTADVHNPYDVVMDQMSLAEYLQSRGASKLLRTTIASAYVGEYGREIEYQSALNFLMYIRANRRSKFQPFGTSDQRYHVVEGNDAIAKGLYARVQSQVTLGLGLVAAKKTAAGRIELTFQDGNKTTTRTHDVVVIAIPFTVLRGLQLDGSLGLPAWKTQAIQQLGYGSNSKNMVGFDGRPWADQGSNSMTYGTLPNLQNAWETSWTTATASKAVMTNFTGGALGASQDPTQIQAQTAAFLADLDKVYPGASALASRDKNGYRAQMMAWPKNPWSKGSYTCYLTGQFTSIAGNEGKPVGNVYFAGEHADSFYNQQGFMEGALQSGITASAAILAAAKKAA